MQLLVYLAQRAEHVVSREEIEAEIWHGQIVTEDAVTSAIAKLRRALADNARHPRFIETVPKVGYRLMLAPSTTGARAETSGQRFGALAAERSRDGRAQIRWTIVSVTTVLLMVVFWALPLIGTFLPPTSRPGERKPAVAVLAFKNLGPSPKEDYFARGIADDLITDLAKVSSLSTIASRSIDYYNQDAARPREISAELKADYIVDGSVQRQGNKLRFNVQLVEGRSERVFWSNRYDGSANDVFGLQDALVVDVLAALRVRLTPDEKASLARRPTISIEAYDQYLQGIEQQGRRSREDNLTAKIHLKHAIKLDPGFARAYAGLAMAHSRDAIDGWVADPLNSLEMAKEMALKAARIDPSIPQVQFVKGQIELFRRRYVQAIAAAIRAIEIDPGYADAYALRAWILNYAGRPEEAKAAIEEAFRLNSRPTASYLEVLGEILFVQGRYSDSASTFEKVLSINPAYMRARMWAAAAHALAGDREAAEWDAGELLVLAPDFDLDHLQFAFPFRDPRELDTLVGGLEAAGLLLPRLEKTKSDLD
jgi:TolB-like protein